MNSRAVIVSSACALWTFVLAANAHAQTPPPGWYPPPYLAHVSIDAAPSAELAVLPAKGSGAIARCMSYCDFWALPGRYTLYSLDHNSGERENLALRIAQSGRYKLEPGDSNSRNAGLALGVGGAAALAIGFLLIAPSLLDQMGEATDSATKGESAVANVGLGLLLVGAVATPIGWTMFLHNQPHLQRLDEGSAATTDSSGQVRVGVVGLGRGGLGLGAVAAF